MKVTKPVLKKIRVWSELPNSAHQDCFETTDWEMFKQAATYNNTTDIEVVTSYISKCIDDVTHSMIITIQANWKP